MKREICHLHEVLQLDDGRNIFVSRIFPGSIETDATRVEVGNVGKGAHLLQDSRHARGQIIAAKNSAHVFEIG